MAANNHPKNAIFLLDLYKESIGIPENIYEHMKGLLSTAFQEGILYQLDKDTNEIINKIHDTIAIQNHS